VTEIELSAPVVIIVLLIGSSLAGLAGALIGLPVTAALKVVIREVRSDAGRGDLSPLGSPSS
jgi:predicted PurR-regulated permease PerM